MPEILSELEKQVIAAIQGDMPIIDQPYLEIAESLGIAEDLLLDTLRDLVARGIIRRFGATLRHQKSGYQSNAMVAWRVDEARIEDVGGTMASFQAVSHCYRRDPTPQWPYNLYTMVHGKSEADCRQSALEMSEKSGVGDYALLFSKRELKKTSMQYFGADDEE